MPFISRLIAVHLLTCSLLSFFRRPLQLLHLKRLSNGKGKELGSAAEVRR